MTLSPEEIFDLTLRQYGQRFRNLEYYTDRSAFNRWATGVKADLGGQFDFQNEYECYFGILEYLTPPISKPKLF